jgi:hypothetical protein
MINIQWAVMDTDRNQLCLPSSSKVPAEVNLLQLWKMFIWKKTHYREGNIIEAGKVSSLEEGDAVEILVDSGAPPTQTHVDIRYMIGTETFSTRVKKGTTIEELRGTISYAHKGKQIVGIAMEGTEIDKADPVDGWLTRSL